MKKILLILLGVFLVITFLSGCVEETVDMKQAMETEKILAEANRQIGMPNIDDFYEKKMLKRIYELRDNASLVTYTYTTALDGRKVFLFKSIGYGLPMSVQYSNPQKYTGVATKSLVNDTKNYDYVTMPQPEPNGLFMPEGLSATWIMRLNNDGTTEPIYIEEEITVSQTKLPRRLCAEWSLPDNY